MSETTSTAKPTVNDKGRPTFGHNDMAIDGKHIRDAIQNVTTKGNTYQKTSFFSLELQPGRRTVPKDIGDVTESFMKSVSYPQKLLGNKSSRNEENKQHHDAKQARHCKRKTEEPIEEI